MGQLISIYIYLTENKNTHFELNLTKHRVKVLNIIQS